jgi:hypothetical protein
METDHLNDAIVLVTQMQADEEALKRTLSVERKMYEHKIVAEDRAYEDTWTSCCLTVDRRATTFFTQMFIILLVMVFAIVQLIRLDDCNSQQAYLGLLTMLLGILIPSPKFNKST